VAAGLSGSAEAAERRTSNRFERHPALTGLTIAMILLLAIDLVVGQVVGMRNLRVTERGFVHEQRYRVSHPRYHHGLAPGTSTDSALWGTTFYRVRTNSLGFKDGTPQHDPLGDTLAHVLLLGDSFTEGLGVEYGETFAGRLDARARSAGVEVLNAAVSSYSPLIYWRKTVDLVERSGLRVDEALVFLDVSDVQDEVNYSLDRDSVVHNRRGEGSWRARTRESLLGLDSTSGPLKRFVAPLHVNASLTHRWLYAILHRGQRTGQGSEPPGCDPALHEGVPACRAGWTADPRLMARYGAAGLASADEHMSRLAAFLAGHAIPLTVVVYPWSQQLYWNDRRSIQVTHWRDWCAARGIRFVEVFSDVFAAVDSAGLTQTVQRLYIPGDIHFSSAGHELVADRFARRYCAFPSAAGARPLERALCDTTAFATRRAVLPPPVARR
jgi:hypothetical protein